MTNNLICT